MKPSGQARAVNVCEGFGLVCSFVRLREADPTAKANTRLGVSASPRPRSAVLLQSILDACIGVQCAIPTQSHLVWWKFGVWSGNPEPISAVTGMLCSSAACEVAPCKFHCPRHDFLQDVCNETCDLGQPRADSSACGMQQQGRPGEETCEVKICFTCSCN